MTRRCNPWVLVLAVGVVVVNAACAGRGTTSTPTSAGGDTVGSESRWVHAFKGQQQRTLADLTDKEIFDLESDLKLYFEWRDDPERIRNVAAVRLRLENKAEAFRAALLEALSKGTKEQQRIAASALGFVAQNSKDQSPARDLLLALTSRTEAVPYFALIGLSELARSEQLSLYKDRRDLIYAMALFLADENPLHREWAAEALGFAVKRDEFHDVQDALTQRLAQESDADIRQVLVFSLSTIGSPKCHDAILSQGLHDPNPDVRRFAVSALAKSRHEQYIDAVIAALDDRNSGVRVEAVMSVPTFRDSTRRKDLMREIRKRLSDTDAAVREAAVLVMGDIGDDSVVLDVLGKLGDQRRGVRLAALDTLGKLRNQQAILPLIKLMVTREEDIKSACRQALVRITSYDLGEDATQWQAWYDAGRPPMRRADTPSTPIGGVPGSTSPAATER